MENKELELLREYFEIPSIIMGGEELKEKILKVQKETKEEQRKKIDHLVEYGWIINNLEC